MTGMTLFCAPGAVSRAVLIVLEEKGIPFTPHMISLAKGDHLKPDFLAVNPKGKVPALLVNDVVLSETPAILAYLDARFPEQAILPKGDAMAHAQALSDMAWFASAVHPNFPRIFRTVRFCDLPEAQERVREQARDLLADCLDLIEGRLTGRDWWYDNWSALDAYAHWAWLLLDRAKVENATARWPAFAAHAERMGHRPAVMRALAHEVGA